jgi:hypothetical protein
VRGGSVIVSSDIVRSQAEKRQQTQWRDLTKTGEDTPGPSEREGLCHGGVPPPRFGQRPSRARPVPASDTAFMLLTLSIEVRRDRLPQSFAMLVPIQGGRP